MKEEDYGENFKKHLLEQYKLYVELSDNISARRNRSNIFYVSILSGLLAILSLVEEQNILSNFHDLVLLCVCITGFSLCIVWFINIRSYRQLNSGKFKIINEMEKYLPYSCYGKEWKILGEGKQKKKYLKLTGIERSIPLLFMILYLILSIFSIFKLVSLI